MNPAPNFSQGVPSMNPLPDSSQESLPTNPPPDTNKKDNTNEEEHWGCIFTTLFTLVCFLFVIGSIATAWSTQNPLLILGAFGIAVIGLLAIPTIHNKVVNRLRPYLNDIDGKVTDKIKQGVVKVWRLHDIILVFIIFGLVIGDPVLNLAKKQYDNFVCVQNQTPWPSCGNGIGVTSMFVSESKNNSNIISSMNIGIIDSMSAGPFNQYDTHNHNIERNLEKSIFQENQNCARPSYVTLIVATSLSQTVTDTALSSNVGLDELRAAYMAQYNFNHNPSQHLCLHLLIANFGTKGVVSQTVPTLMQQAKLYAGSDLQHFAGIVGFPFSVSVTQALYSRSNTIPIVSSSSVADSFSDPAITPNPANFYTNVYRVVSPVSVESKVLADFVQNYLAPTKNQTLLFEDRDEKYSQALGSAISQQLGANNTAYYTEGKPDSLDDGIKDIIQNHYTQIFFSGFADDLNALKNKLRTNGLLSKNIRVIGGEGLYDLGPYNEGNYANLFFAINASYAQISQDISLKDISVPNNDNCPSQNIAPFNSNFTSEFCHLFNYNNPPTAYGHKLPGHHVLLMYDAVETFLHALPSADNTASSPLWQTINQNLPTVHFPGVSGMVRFASPDNNTINNPINKPIYIACTDSNGYTHAIGQYVNGSISQPGPNRDELNKCTNG